MIGKTLAHYRIEEKLGAGGMGEVYRASDTKLGRDVALKVIPAEFARDEERMARFQREAQVLASLNHPNIAQIYGVEEFDGGRALVLELVTGPTLGDRIRTGRIPTDEILSIASQIAQALESAHDLGVIHRDLKPENVKLDGEGRVKVLDFGLAKALEGAGEDLGATQSPTISPAITGAMTAANVILGTAGYMSPEQARGQAVDKRADIWSFGVVLWEMLTGRRLFIGDTVSDTLAAVLRLEPDFDVLPDKTPRRVRRLLQRCLERDPKQRLRDIGEARLALAEVISGEPGDEPVPAPAEPAPSGPRGRILAVAGVAVVAAAAIAFLAGTRLGPPPPEVPLLRFRIPVADLVTSLGFGGTSAAISPDGTRVAFTRRDGIWIRNLAELDARPIPDTVGGHAVFWSPDGEWLAYGDDRRLYKVRADGGAPVVLCEVTDGFNPAAGGAWGEDGRIVFTHGNGPLLSVSSQGGDPDTALACDPELDDDFHNAALLPDNRGVLFVTHRKGGSFDRIEVLSRGERKVLVSHEDINLSLPCWSPSGHLVYQREESNPGVWAVPFSLDRLEVTGEPFLAVPQGGIPSVSRTGTMVLTLGDFSETSELGWLDRDGNLQATVGEPANRQIFFSLSPDGGRVAFRLEGENPDIWVLDVERGTQTRLTFTDGRESFPVWSADGKRVFYQLQDDFPDTKVWAKAADGGGEALELGPGAWSDPSRDGRFLATSVHTPDSSDWDIWYWELGPDGLPAGDAVVLVDDDAISYQPRFSPDGRYVAYGSNESGTLQIYVKRFPEGSGKWQVSVDGGMWPFWREDGRELFFVDGVDMMSVEVDLDDGVRLGTPRVLFTRPGSVGTLPFGWADAYASSRDGERFLVALREDRGDAETADRGLVVVQNWFSEFAEED